MTMKLILRTALVISCSSLFACTNPQEGNTYFPLQKNLVWKYQVETKYNNETIKDTLSITSLGKQMVGGKSYYIRRTSSGIDYYINFDDQGVYREAKRTMVEIKPRPDPEKRFIFKFPLQPDTNWRQVSQPLVLLYVFPFRQRLTGIQIPMSYHIDSLDAEVTVPAGTFKNCLKITGEGFTEIFTDSINGFYKIPIEVEEWYAPDIGLVKQVRYELDGETISISETPVYIGGRSSLELTAFSD